MDFISTLLIAAVSAGTPLLLAALGGILSERAGIIHLGAEGIMLIGAVTCCMIYIKTGSLFLGLITALLAGGALGALHSFLCVTLKSNQVVSGLAMTLFGTGISAYLGKSVTGTPVPGTVPKVDLPFLEKVPLIGPVFAHLDILVWFSLLLVLFLHFYIFKTPWGLHLRAIGDSPATADAMGISVNRNKYLYVIFGSMLMSLAGSYLIAAYSPSWIEGMTAGRGWIAVALVIFARWNPFRALVCACLFGGLDALGFRIQALDSEIPSYFLKMIPYLLTIFVLMAIGWRNRNQPSGTPLSLGDPYIREERF
jgi:general nucleoside transport system permease protein